MILGVGVDICQISRVHLDIARRVLSNDELLIFEAFKTDSRKLEYLAGRFSVKEAIIKALSGLYNIVGMREITILNKENGVPYVVEPLIENARLLISISHEKEYCVGYAIIESNDNYSIQK